MIAERTRANTAFFAAESTRLAALCDEMAQRFLRGGRLLAVGEESDARHVAVEFVHPVIVGKRALPALALPRSALPLEAEPDDIVEDALGHALAPQLAVERVGETVRLVPDPL